MRRCVIVIALTVGTLFCMSASIRVDAQIPNTKAPDPISPNIASIARYGNIPIGLYTGQPNVSFPLYEIDNGYIKVPITLSYNYNGFKIEDYPGWVGMGWTVNGTGVITRQQRSLPDESPGGFNGPAKNGKRVIDYLNLGLTGDDVEARWIQSPEEYDDLYDLLTAFANGQADSEPDMFVFSCPGHSGKFFFDETQCDVTVKTAKVVPHQNVTIKGYFDYNALTNGVHGAITKFEITDERGIVYAFEKKERSGRASIEDIDDGNADPDFQNSWLLTSIEDPFGKTISYTYKAARHIALPATVVDRMVVPDQLISTPRFSPSSTWENVLDKIEYRNSTNDLLGEVLFTEDPETRLDWNSATWPEYVDTENDLEQPRSLSHITIRVANKTIKRVLFNYSYFDDNARLRLDSFQEVNGNESMPSTKFDYMSGSFPKIGDRSAIFSQDHWGYYTGGINSTLIPPVTWNLNDVAIDPDPNITGDEYFQDGDLWIDIPGNNRAPKPQFASAGLLNRIQYPTGGTTEFEYEANDYYLANNVFDIPSPTCSEINRQESVLSLKFDLPPTVNKSPVVADAIHISHEVCARIEYTLSAGNCIDNTATVRMINTETGVEIFNHHQMVTPTGTVTNTSGPDSDDTFILKPGDYEINAMIECVYCPYPLTFTRVQAKVVLYLSSDPENQPVNVSAGGMRVKKVTDCVLEGVSGCTSKFFQYRDIEHSERSSGNLVSPPAYQYPTLVYQTIGIGGESGHTFVAVPGTVFSGSSLVPVTVTMGNTVGYTYVTVLEAEDGSKGKSLHKFTSPEEYRDGSSSTTEFTSSGLSFYPYPPLIDNDYKRGLLLIQGDYATGVTDPVKKSETSPQFITQSTARGLKVGPRFVDPVGLPAGEKSPSIGPFHLTGYDFAPYNIEPAWRRTAWQEETVKDQLSDQTLTTRTEFTYGTQKHLLPIERIFTNSEGQVIRTTYNYRDDAAALSELTSQQKTDIQSSPDETILIQQKTYKGNLLQQTQLNLYEGPLLRKSLLSRGNGPLTEEVSFTHYDQEGKPLSFTLKSGEIHSYQYGYNAAYPVFHVINASPNDVFVENFESSVSATFYEEQAHTGRKALTASSYTFPSTYTPGNLAGTRMSYWYWDANQWKYSGQLNYASTFTAPGLRLDDIRAYPEGAVLQTFTFLPGVGMTSRTDHNGRIQYFKFDDIGRLKSVQDEKKNMLSYYDYYFKNGN